MTIKIIGVSCVVMTIFHTPIDTNFLFLSGLLVGKLVTTKMTFLGCFVLTLVTPVNFWTFLDALCLLEKAGINAEKSNITLDRLAHVFLSNVPIFGTDSPENLRTL